MNHDVHPEAPISALFFGESECLPFGCCWQWCIPAVDMFTFSNFLSFLEISIPNVDKTWQTFGFFWVFSSAGKTWKTMATQTPDHHRTEATGPPRWRSESGIIAMAWLERCRANVGIHRFKMLIFYRIWAFCFGFFREILLDIDLTCISSSVPVEHPWL